MKAKATPAVSATPLDAEPVPTRRPAKGVPLFHKGSAMAKSPLGKLAEIFRDVPPEKLKPWPIRPCPCCGR